MTGFWIGVDPGAAHTGIVSRHGNRLLAHAVVQRTEDEDTVRGVGVGPDYVHAVLETINQFQDQAYVEHSTHPQVAVEGIVRPNPHVRRKDGSSLIDAGTVAGTAMVLGAVIAVWPRAVIVPPNNHGHGPLASYPHELVTAGEMRHGLHREAPQNTDLRHARSAWDCAGQGPVHAAIRSARRGGATA